MLSTSQQAQEAKSTTRKSSIELFSPMQRTLVFEGEAASARLRSEAFVNSHFPPTFSPLPTVIETEAAVEIYPFSQTWVSHHVSCHFFR